MLQLIRRFAEKSLRRLYRITLNYKINTLKTRDKISVLFILNDLSKWKSEELYLEMLNNEKFTPILGITIRRGESIESCSQKVVALTTYLNRKGYDYIELGNTLKPTPDIVIYTEPYGEAVPRKQSIFAYWRSLFISINYSCHTTHLDIDYFTRLHECAWIDCYESKSAAMDAYKYIGNRRHSIRLTGLPIFDQLNEAPMSDPWKVQEHTKKRIIWAPHHSLGKSNVETIVYGNFLECSQYMLELANVYKETVQFAFKPHPLLKEKLYSIWGEKKTNDYYNAWKNLSNGQLELGAYQDLFKHSDALIHDCSSFIVEYQFLNKPILFMVRNEDKILEDMNSFGKQAFYTQTLAYTKEDIIDFINAVINNSDLMYLKRKEFITNDIIYEENMTASRRIIEEILSLN